MWSLGCILAEMLFSTQMSRNSEEKVFFKGEYCYPLTPKKKNFKFEKNETTFLTFTEKQAEYENQL